MRAEIRKDVGKLDQFLGQAVIQEYTVTMPYFIKVGVMERKRWRGEGRVRASQFKCDAPAPTHSCSRLLAIGEVYKYESQKEAKTNPYIRVFLSTGDDGTH